MKNSLFIFDTNTLISAAILYSSTSRKALDKANHIGHLVFSEDTLIELSSVLIRSKFDKYISLSDRLEFIQRVEIESIIKETLSVFTNCRDEKDNVFLNLAFDAEATCIVTGDMDLLVLNPFNNIPIITPADFLNTYS